MSGPEPEGHTSPEPSSKPYAHGLAFSDALSGAPYLPALSSESDPVPVWQAIQNESTVPASGIEPARAIGPLTPPSKNATILYGESGTTVNDELGKSSLPAISTQVASPGEPAARGGPTTELYAKARKEYRGHTPISSETQTNFGRGRPLLVMVL